MRSSTARTNEQLDPQCSMQTYRRPNQLHPVARKLLLISLYGTIFSGSCITDMELSSAEGHVVENTINIQILIEDLSVFSFFS